MHNAGEVEPTILLALSEAKVVLERYAANPSKNKMDHEKCYADVSWS